MRYRDLCLIALFCSILAVAGTAATEDINAAPNANTGFWHKTWSLVEKAWEKTRQAFRFGDTQDSFAQVWDEIVPTLDQALTLTDQHASLPERSWLGRDQSGNRQAIDELLDEVAHILTISPSKHYREQIRELNNSVLEARREIAELRRRRVSAPRDSMWQKSMTEYDAAIEEIESRIAHYNQQLDTIHQAYAAELQALGLEITTEELEFLLSTVVGDDLVQMPIAFDNIRSITRQLEQLTEETQEDIVTARRYYGMYTVLLKVLDRMHEQIIQDLDERYLAEINAILDRTQQLLKETRTLHQSAGSRQPALNANIDAQQFTLYAARNYREYLLEQRHQLGAARRRLIQDIAVAVNTYETVKISGELVDLMKSSQYLLDNLRSLQVPALRTFNNLDMKREFQRLTLHLKGETSP